MLSLGITSTGPLLRKFENVELGIRGKRGCLGNPRNWVKGMHGQNAAVQTQNRKHTKCIKRHNIMFTNRKHTESKK